VNLLTANQTTFVAGSTGNWVGSNATLSSTGSALQVTATASSLVSAWTALMPSGQPTVAIPGDKYTGQADVSVTNPSPAIDDALVFFNAAGSVLVAVWGQAVSPTASSWTTLPEIAGIAPSGTAFVGLGVMSWNAVIGHDFFVENPALSVFTTPNVAPAVVGPLHTSGNQIIQANGQAVSLRGVVMPGLEQQGTTSGTGVSQQAVNEAKAWGSNFVRVPLGEQFWLSSNCDYVASYIATVDQVVNWITSQGMVALLDLHTNTVGLCEAGSPHNMADEAQAPTFWSQVAQRYGNPSSPEYNPLVAFDLYNEPHNISDAVWLNGGTRHTRQRGCNSFTTQCAPLEPRTSSSSAETTGAAPHRRCWSTVTTSSTRSTTTPAPTPSRAARLPTPTTPLRS
jgi:endoglucanase